MQSCRSSAGRLARAAHRHPPQRLAINGGGAFPAPARARVLWAGVRADSRALQVARGVGGGWRPPGRRAAAGRGQEIQPAPDACSLP